MDGGGVWGGVIPALCLGHDFPEGLSSCCAALSLLHSPFKGTFMKPAVFGALLICASLVVAADAPKSPKAATARKAYDQQVKWAESQYAQTVNAASAKLQFAIKEAHNEYRAKLQSAMDDALKTKNVEEVTRIAEELKRPPETPAADNEGLRKALTDTHWLQREFPSRMTIKADWLIDSHTNTNPVVRGLGTWAILDDGRVRIGFPGIQTKVFQFDGKTLKADGMTWDKVNSAK